MRLLALLISLALLAAFAVLAWQNAAPVEITYPGGTLTVPLAVFAASVLILGWLFGVVSMMLPWLRERLRARKIERRCRIAEQEIANLREIPLKDGP
ncbi:LapA family protein [Candidatus Macondimonas diazotrophica]|jgi:uncharacterized integral membrane protein|uniref:LapA family protein n=1 Tax=Candidatus Macondimonas diazotrophica TaxID=2305248 RepID=A0A4Z0FBJ2_9GAMM|nr:LapA family protein [Candidatus Macondimonas diazotrophica]MDY6956602.1 LapA family protein [Pseudomonadota bacterium]HBG31669.1 hypothetical protein [Gammaproteobacteria bacterium]NCU00081.1 LapA family protein [Candidatus Macondimonas diazotrophica]TFZ83866.1 LapA family protein [Candidatus Macondimonas diazotrophica]HBG52001.1 hypothetical protein [Gammaproteobacteria bacterium]